MKKIVKSVLLIALPALIVFVNSSCNIGNRHPHKTKALDSIVPILDSMNNALAKSDTVLIRNYVNHIFITIGQVQRSVTDSKDTISKGAAEILRTFNGIRWQLQAYMGRQPILITVIKNSEEQLKNLSHDIKNNRIPADSVDIYFDVEMKKAKELSEAARQSFKSLDIELPLYNLIVPKADSLINRLNKHEGI